LTGALWSDAVERFGACADHAELHRFLNAR
jgi:hypothetical protein